MDLQRLRIVVEAKRPKRLKDISPSDRLSFFQRAFFSGFRGDEGDEL
jgi:hypothetical protein